MLSIHSFWVFCALIVLYLEIITNFVIGCKFYGCKVYGSKLCNGEIEYKKIRI